METFKGGSSPLEREEANRFILNEKVIKKYRIYKRASGGSLFFLLFFVNI